MMKYNPEIHNRKSLRLKGFDYSRPGAYSITLCTQNRECLFGEIMNNEMIYNEYGLIVKQEWIKSEEIRNEIKLDVYQIMPNHLHAIVWIINVGDDIYCRDKRPFIPTINKPGTKQIPKMRPRSLSSLMAGFESSATKKINQLRSSPGCKVWQYNFYDHIIRNKQELYRIGQYIIDNPKNWKNDEHNPKTYSKPLERDPGLRNCLKMSY
ncbi:MAG: transposase [Bacteroidota bacterium]